MKAKEEKEHILIYKILFTLIVIVAYIVGRNVSVYGVDVSAYETADTLDVQTVFLQSFTGGSRNTSIFILGLWPYMIASIFAMVYMAIKSLDKKTRLSPNHLNRASLVFMMLFAMYQATVRVRGFIFLDGYDHWSVKGIAFLELIAGMLLIIFMCSLVTKYGVGGRGSIFLVNIYEGILTMIANSSWEEAKLPIAVGIAEAFCMILLDNTEKRLPVQRVSIHSIYADKNYIAYSFATVGVISLMFSSAFFSLTQMLFGTLARFYPDNARVVWTYSNLYMTTKFGMIVYIAIIWIINISFSFLMLRPYGMADGLNKSGDSIENVYAGKKTKLYLIGTVARLSIISSIVYSIFMGVPFYLYLKGYLDSSLLLLPTSIMMTTGLWLMIYREAEVYINLERYKPLI